MVDRDKSELDRRQFLKSAAIGAALGGGFLGGSGITNLLASPIVTGVTSRPVAAGQGRPFEMLVLGDSIMWGQGLKEEQKFSYKVVEWLRHNVPGITVHRHVFAHSGARIKPDAVQDGKPPTHGEVPNHFPSITAQLANAQNAIFPAAFPPHPPLDPRNVALVLLDGGINDFGTKVILNLDFTKGRAWVREQTRQVCVERMRGLLPQVLQAFPNAKVVTTNYFQIVSEQSNMVFVWELLRGWEIVGPAVNLGSGRLRTKLSDQSLAFHEESTAGFRDVVEEASRQLLANTKPIPWNVATTLEPTPPPPSRVALAEIPFGPRHSYGAPETLLFYVNEPDPAASVRKPKCVSQVPNASLELPNCLLAAAGHPNVAGASVYANAIIGVLQRWLPEWQATFASSPPKTSSPDSRSPVVAPKRPVPRP